MTVCPVCTASTATVVLERDRVPVLQNVILKTRQEALDFPVGRLRICLCDTCSFVWNADFDPERISYGLEYNNSVQASAVYLAHQTAMTEKVLAVPGRLNCLEIGCGEAEFLQALSATGRLDLAIGIDPAHKGHDGLDPGIRVIRAYFDAALAATLPDSINVVMSRHTIEHIPAPRPFIEAIARFARDKAIPLFLETPDVSWIFRNNAFEDFFYEHCSLFSPRSIAWLLREYGLACRVEPVFDGQYMWISSDPEAAMPAEDSNASAGFGDGNSIGETLDHWRSVVRERNAEGPVAIWGGASKGVTFALLIDGVDCAIDLNGAKQGCFMPVSGLPILAPDVALSRGIRTVIVMNRNYRREIEAELAAMGFDGTVLCL